MSNSKKSRRSYYFAAALLLSCFTAVAEDTNDFHSWVVLPGLVWGAETNGTRAGITAVQGVNGITVYVDKRQHVLNWTYVAPPNARFSKIELQDTNGTVITPIKGEKLDGDLPQQILLNDLPREPKIGTKERYSGGGLWDVLYGVPDKLKVFSIEEAYRIEKEGDYTLTVYPVIYHHVTDQPFVTRFDLPCVTTKIHLVPTREK